MSYSPRCHQSHTQALKADEVSHVGSMVQSVYGERKNQSTIRRYIKCCKSFTVVAIFGRERVRKGGRGQGPPWIRQ